MPLYRATRRYANGRILLQRGDIAEFDPAEAARIDRDSAGVLVPLSVDEVAEIERGLAELAERTGAEIRPDWSPAVDTSDVDRGRGPGGGAMHAGNMPGLTGLR